MSTPSSFQDIQSGIQSALVTATRTTNSLAAEDLAFHRSLDRNVATSLDRQNARLLALADRLLNNAADGSKVDAPRLRDADDVENNWRRVVDVIDNLLEKTDTTLDEFTGAVKRLTPNDEQSALAPKARQAKSKNLYRTQQDLEKPQLSFEHVPTNDEIGPFKPLLTSKPHATVPLEESLKLYTDDDGKEQYPHPYQTEIENYNYPASVYTTAEPVPPQPYETTTATLVDTPEALQEMLSELKQAREIAIDLEHHDTRTYIGIVSLMQISTRNKDWIVDTLRPWRRKLECLNEVFTDPSIVKVLHGAYMDAVWLQRDLGLYLVGLFDTHWASRALGYAGGSLAFLLQKFVNFEAQKQYQMADWRIRPLPQELFDYARSDTHFLLYIYDNMRNELVERSDFSNPEQDKVRYVLEKSKETALQRYENQVYDAVNGTGPVGWLRPLLKTPAQFSKEQFSVFRAIHQWRDHLARQEDESVTYVLTNHALFNIARAMPDKKAQLLNLASPVSPILRLHADALLSVISQAKADGPNGPELVDVLNEALARRRGADPEIVAETIPQLEEAAPLPETALVVDVHPVRSESSRFWGNAFSSSVWNPKPSTAPDLALALPLPPLTAEIFADPADQATESTPATPKPEHTFVKKSERPAEDDDEGIFVIKQLGGLRKRKLEQSTAAEAEDEEDGREDMADTAADAMDLPIADLETDQKASKKQRKAEKKAAKKLKKEQEKQQRAGTANGTEADEEEYAPPEAFDYDNAPSVLNAQAAEAQSGKGRKDKAKGKNTAFDPYKKAMDAPKGLRRVQRESAGRSATFKK